MTSKRKSSSKDLTETTESRAAFARRLQIDAGYLTRLIQKGLPVNEDGKLVRVEAAIAWMRANIGKPGRQPGSVNGGGDSADLVSAKVDLIRIQVEKASIELSTLRGETVQMRDAVKAVRAFSRVYRDYFLNFGNRWAASIAAELGTAPGLTGAVLDKYIRDALFEVAATPPPFDLDETDPSYPMSEPAIKDAIDDK